MNNNLVLTLGSESMVPAIQPGDFIVIFPADAEEVTVGDIILFWNGRGDKVPHRVIEVHREQDSVYFTTKGDNNQGIWNYEKHISSSRVIGKVHCIIRFPAMQAVIFALILSAILPSTYIMYRRVTRAKPGGPHYD